MKNHFCFVIFFSFLFISACKEEPTSAINTIELDRTSIYEGLPNNTYVARISSDVSDFSINYKLTEGEGDDHNDEFLIDGFVLRTNRILHASEGGVRSIRLKATLDDDVVERTFLIDVQSFDADELPSINSGSFNDGGQMPEEFGADFGNVSPDLLISDVPSQTSSMVLTMRDIDNANSWHWAVWNIPPDKTFIMNNDNFASGGVVGDCDYGPGYVGPFPPTEHRYEINVFFLLEDVTLEPSDYGQLGKEMAGKLFAHTSMIGSYK